MATFSGSVNANGQDGNRWASSGFFNSTFYFGNVGENTHAWCYFPSVTIPQGATISAATIQFTYANSSANTNPVVRISCDDSDSPAAPTNAAGFDGKARTTAYTDWTVPDGTTGTTVNTADFTSALQEVVSRGGWSSGNIMGTLFDVQSGTQWREFNQNETGSGKPTLNATYTTGSAGSPAYYYAQL